MKRFEGKVVLITGGGSGIGKNTAAAFAAEGATVAIAGRTMSRLEATAAEISEQGGGKVFPVQADVSKADQVQSMVALIIKEFGVIDVLNNHAGILSPADASILDIEEEVIDSTLQNNVKSQMLVGKYVSREMVKRGKGTIVNTGSDLSFIAIPGVCSYVTSKAAIIGLTRAMAVDLGSYGIRVNAVCPGFVYDTIMTNDMAEDIEMMQEMKKSYILQQLGRPKDISPAILHLASDESAFTTGSYLIIDGGHTIW